MFPPKIIHMDVWNDKQVPHTIEVVKGEVNARKAEIHFESDSTPVDLTGYGIQAFLQKPDQTVVYNDFTITDTINGIAQLGITSEISAVVSDGIPINIHITGANPTSDGIVLGVTIIVKDSLGMSTVTSSNEFTTLQTLISEAGDLTNKISTVKVNGTALTQDANHAVNVLCATPTQGTKADSAIQGIQVNGTDLTIDSNKKVNVLCATPVQGTTADNAIPSTEKGMTVATLLNGNLAQPSDWLSLPNTFTYASASVPQLIASGDLTSQICAGMKIKLTQSTDKYFIVMAVIYTSPNTTVLLYGGTDYALTSDAISNVYTSTAKAPRGFPLNPDKWTITVRGSGDVKQTSPTLNTFYNTGGYSISLPLGLWDLSYDAEIGGVANSVTGINFGCFLSSSSIANVDVDFKSYFFAEGATSVMGQHVFVRRSKIISATSAIVYYFVIFAGRDGMAEIGLYNGEVPLILSARCAYL